MSSILTIILFLFAQRLYQRWNILLFVPVFFSTLGCVLLLLWLNIPFETYLKENRALTFLLGPSIVALGVVLHKQWLLVQQNRTPLLISVLVGSVSSLILVSGFSWIFSFSPEITASLFPLGITTPIAIEVSVALGGNAALTSVIVIGVGLFGNLMGPYLLNLFQIQHKPARGFSMGQSSHGIGTARAVQMGETEATFSGLAMSLNGIITVFTAPFIWNLFFG